MPRMARRRRVTRRVGAASKKAAIANALSNLKKAGITSQAQFDAAMKVNPDLQEVIKQRVEIPGPVADWSCCHMHY